MKHILIFLCGIGIGAAGALLYLRHDFEQKVSEEVQKIIDDSLENGKKAGSDGGSDEENQTKNDISKAENGSFGNSKRAEMEYREAYLKGATDAFGYTNYSGEEGSARVLSPDFDPKSGKNEEKNEPKTSFKNGKNGMKIEEKSVKNEEKTGENWQKNEKSYVSLLKNKSGACATKSDTLDDFEPISPPEDGFFEPPYGISDEKFYVKDGKFSKKTLIYYAKDDTFTDECATLCANVSLLVGEKWRTEVGKFEENVAFIRNEKISTDFEIIVENDSYGDVVKPDFGEV